MSMQPASEKHFEPNPFHMGDRIRKARELCDMDRQTFAELIGIHRQTLQKYEETGQKVKRAMLISVAWNTPVRLEWLESGELPWLKEGEDPHPASPSAEKRRRTSD